MYFEFSGIRLVTIDGSSGSVGFLYAISSAARWVTCIFSFGMEVNRMISDLENWEIVKNWSTLCAAILINISITNLARGDKSSGWRLYCMSRIVRTWAHGGKNGAVYPG